MAAKDKFDYLIVGIGWQRYVMSADAARKFFDACTGDDVYKLDTTYENGQTHMICAPLTPDHFPRLEVIGPAQFFAAIEFGKELAERKAAEEAAKKAAKP